MSNFVPTKRHLRKVLLHYFILKKIAAESYCLLVKAYSEHSLAENTCREWFRKFKSNDFDVKDEGSKKNLKMQNWKYYWMKIRAKQKQI